MPVARYFLFVGGVLLALLVVVGSYLPQPPVVTAVNTGANTDSDKPFMIRINSERKWPEAVVYDTAHPPAVAAPAAVATNVPAPAPEISANARVREAYAQFQPSDLKQMHPSKQQVQPQMPPPAAKVAQLKPQPKRRVARNRVGPPMVLAAQQPRFGFFFNNTW